MLLNAVSAKSLAQPRLMESCQKSANLLGVRSRSFSLARTVNEPLFACLFNFTPICRPGREAMILRFLRIWEIWLNQNACFHMARLQTKKESNLDLPVQDLAAKDGFVYPFTYNGVRIWGNQDRHTFM